jgi:hypothetical protein
MLYTVIKKSFNELFFTLKGSQTDMSSIGNKQWFETQSPGAL